MFVCSDVATPAPVARRLAELQHCCLDAIELGPHACTCWEPVYDCEQAPLLEGTTPGQRTDMCADCAYRPDSPERNGDDRQACSDDGELDDIARGSNPFWCHQGLRKPTAYRHATLGITVPTDVDAYDPPLVTIGGQQVPVKADGTAGDRGAGWAARKRQLEVLDG
jgi:hypothetical protein